MIQIMIIAQRIIYQGNVTRTNVQLTGRLSASNLLKSSVVEHQFVKIQL